MKEDIVKNTIEVFSNGKKALLSILIFFSTFIISLALTDLNHFLFRVSVQGLDHSILFEMFNALYLTSGYLGVLLTFFFSLLFGILTSLVFFKIKKNGLRSGGYLGASLPGFLAGGCAACGASLIPILGLSSSALIFPASGNIWRFLGILLLIFAISKVETSKTCSI